MALQDRRQRWRRVSCLAWSLALLIFSCSEKEDPVPPRAGDLVTATYAGARTANELRFFIQFSGRDIDPSLIVHDVNVYRVVYKTTFRDELIEASGLVLLPQATAPVPMISFHHGTIVRQSEAPSLQSQESEEVISYAGLASMGFITVVPDYIGFGESQEVFHPYYVEEPTATAVTDMLKAAVALAETNKIGFSSRLFLAGYSQGGYTTMAVHKALQENPSGDFEVIASFPAAGGYDIGAMQEYFFGLETYDDPHYIAYVGMSYQSYYDEPVLTGFFNEPYASRIPGLFDGIKSPGEINAQLTPVIAELVREELLTQPGTGPLLEFLRGKFAENSLLDWQPEAPVFMYHGDADITVPYENSAITYNTLLSNGANAENLQLIPLPGRDHASGIEPYIEDVVKKLDSLTP